MDWIDLQKGFGGDRDLPARAARLTALAAVRDGEQYDQIPNAFTTERREGGRYIPMQERRPSARTNLCRTAVDDSVSLLFGEAHFPAISIDDEAATKAISAIVKAARLPAVMLEAATRGSIGSVALLVSALENRPFVSLLDTAFLTPKWSPSDPNRLLTVTERYKVDGSELAAQGYPGIDTGRRYWFQRVWDEAAETWFLPWPVTLIGNEKPQPPRIDKDQTLQHGLGRTPIVWIKNLPGGKLNSPDGACTFEPAISTVIELDYLLSQAGRALRYAGDPVLLLKVPPRIGPDGKRISQVGGASDMLEIPPDGDAKLLEISGAAATASLEHCRTLRQIALESIHGNRADADKLASAQSGRAIELLNIGLVWTADKLRSSYGEHGLVEVLKLICEASRALPGGIVVDGETYKGLSPAGITLHWPDYYPPTPLDRLNDANTLSALREAGVMSRATAVRSIASEYDIESVDDEIALIEADEAKQKQRELAENAQVRVTGFAGA